MLTSRITGRATCLTLEGAGGGDEIALGHEIKSEDVRMNDKTRSDVAPT